MRLARWLILILGLDSGMMAAAALESFSPQGSVKKITQVQARFDSDMVDFGNGRAASPLKVDCPVRGDGRWVDARTYVHDFVSEVPGGIRCNFTLVQVKNKAGEKLDGPKVFSFDTGGPQLIRSMPYEESSSVDEDGPMLLVFDSPIQIETLAGHLYFQVAQRADTIGFEKLPEPERYLKDRWPYLLEELQKDPKFYILIKPRGRLPSAAAVTLVIDKGIASPDGVQTAAAQELHFKTRQPFQAHFQCDREKEGGPCTPHAGYTIFFNAALAEKDRSRVRVFDAQNKEVELKRSESYFEIPGPHPADSSYRIEVPADLKDEQGRPLVNAREFPLTVKVGSYGPLIKFPGDFGVLEAAHPIWPLNMRKVEGDLTGRLYKVDSKPASLMEWYKRIRKDDYATRETSIFGTKSGSELKSVALKKPHGPDAFEVLGVPLPSPGFYVMEVSSAKLGAALLDKKAPMYARGSVLVTNLSAQVKKGRQGTLVWVTSLDKGQPVPGAEVLVSDCGGRTLARGPTDASGIFQHKGPLPEGRGNCYGDYGQEESSQDFVVTVTKDGDLSFTLSTWNEGLESWRFQLPWDNAAEDQQIHSILDRSLFRIGETVSMLHVGRKRVKEGLGFPLPKEFPGQVTLQHVGSERQFPMPLRWDDKGRAETGWKIPSDAPLGWYAIMIGDRESGRFRVDEFRLATMRGQIQATEKNLIAPKEIKYDVDVSYLSGGPASELPVRLRRSIQGAFQPRFSGYDDYDFDMGPIERPDAPKQTTEKVETQDLKLDKTGTAHASWPAPRVDRPTRILAEMEFPDANGEARTVASEDRIWPGSIVIGMKSPFWMQKGETLRLSGVALDTQGQAQSRQSIRVKAFKEDVLSHRRRSVGGTYVYEHKIVIKELGDFCETKSDEKGLWNCEKPWNEAGTILLQAEAKDGQGHTSLSHRSIWVSGERLWFMSEDHDRIDLIPEKKHYEAGDKARIQVKMPFAEGLALIAIERDGMILDARVQAIDSKQPFIDVPIQRSYAPNVFVSAWVVRGRVKGTEPLLKIDLGKPAQKLGITELKVGWKQHTLRVKVASGQPIYKIREKAQAVITVQAPEGMTLPADAMATVAVVDEALLELMNNKSWDLLTAMMSERAYGLEHASGTMQVIGKRHFGLKALPQGGGGGSNPTRELFDSLILWKARVPLQDGKATVDFPLQDNLSSFKIVAVAQAGTDLFGTGSTSIQTQQDLSLIAGLPPLVREGDHWQALVTLRNRTKEPQTVLMKASMQGKPLPEKTVQLKAEESQLVSWGLDVPRGVTELKYVFDAVAEKGGRDSLKFVQAVKPVVDVRVLQASLMTLNEPRTLPIALPEHAEAERGGLDLNFTPGPGPDLLEGARLFFKDYPYTCLEQQLSRAIGLDDKKAWDLIVKNLDAYLDRNGLLKYFPGMDDGSMTLTAYFLSASHEAGLALPAVRQEALRYALKRVVEGQTADLEYLAAGDQRVYRKIMALEALTRFDGGDAGLVKNYGVNPELLPHATLIDLVAVLSRDNKDASLLELKDRAVKQLTARLRLSGTQFGLAGEESNAISSLLSSPDSNAARLVLLSLDQNIWTQDQAKMVEGFLKRQQRGAWSTTVANSWGVLALRRYREKHPPAGADAKVAVSYAGTQKEVGLQALHLDWTAKSSLNLTQKGSGEVWATVLARAAVPLKEPFQAGYRLEKSIEAVEQKAKGKWTRGDIVRVKFSIEAGSDQTWVVLRDPIPGGARVLNSGLRAEHELSASFIERRYEGYFAYFGFMPAGKHTISYVMQVNNTGRFQMPTTRLEAMYAPDQYAELPNAPILVD